MRIFIEHPQAVGESYATHARHAAGFGLTMLLGGLACLVHAVLPFLFVTTGSRMIRDLHGRMGPRGRQAAAAARRAAPQPAE